ncbi:hypothetical protein [Amycolatopsis sp. cmx-8-4]|uniref:hypothetical protein n=1 Tax=Amycolatopsis sp. cmx-8-4 TaxID=2790947 RepID=UPI00397DEE6A
MTVDYASLATLLPIMVTALFAIAFAAGLFGQWTSSRKKVRVDSQHEPRQAEPGAEGRDSR